jgi:hypothetical protein
MLQNLKQKISSYIPKLTYSDNDCKDSSPSIKLYTDCDEDGCTKLQLVGFGKFRTYSFDGYKFIEPKKYISKGTYTGGKELSADVAYGGYIYKDFGKYRALNLYYGLEDNTLYNELKEQSLYWTFPWNEKSFKYHRLLNLDGSIMVSVREDYKNLIDYKEEIKLEESQPKIVFNFIDNYDGTELTATCKLSERCWTQGDKSFKWLKYFNEDHISRDLWCDFSGETGKRKGSWKGGTVGCGIELNEDESVTDAFKRLCDRENFTYVGVESGI